MVNIDVLVSEIKAGGVQGIFGLDQLDWSGEAGKLWECWKVAPCCGAQGFEPQAAAICCGMWWCCGLCSASKLYSSALEEPCALWPHCCCMMCCGRTFLRYSLRKKAGVSGNIIGDCCLGHCCGACAFCQELRSVAPSAWNMFMPEVTVPVPVAPNPMKFLYTAADNKSQPLNQ